GHTARSYQSLLAHLSTLTRNDIRYGTHGPTVATLSTPTDTQRRVFDLLAAPIPLTLTRSHRRPNTHPENTQTPR
ncbi:MAG: hypothetical protein ACLP75_16050, partial [Mycobacterium sp.]|uniref:hypothetical protein n=1 Tax=Mycobacterium sp. TaxID=1785 RepID=UPI003F9DB3F4